MSYTHDLIVIGAGSGGLGAAGFGGGLGLRVALIDRTEQNFGGDCLNYGCVPSKALLHVAAQFAGARRATDFGLEIAGRADFKRVMEYVHARQDVIRKNESPQHLREEYGIECIVGEAMLTGKREVSVNGRKLSAPRIVLATGSKPRKLDVPGAETVKQWDNESIFWELDELPEHLLLVGGGPIACELGQAFRRLGSAVTIVNRGERLSTKDPAPCVRALTKRLETEGVRILNHCEVERFPSPTTAKLTGDGAKANQTVEFTHCLVAIGRSVTTQGLGLELAGVQTKDGRIVADDYYRTTNPAIFTVGDAYGREKFSHGAEKHNTDLWTNWLSPIDRRHRLDHFSWVTFTDPEIATFGLTAEQLDQRNKDYETIEVSLAEDDRAVAADYRDGVLILYLSTGPLGGGKLLGGCLAAPAAGEMIQELHLLQTLGKDYSTLTNKIYAYPVGSRINQKAARQRAEKKIFGPWAKRALRAAYRLQNR